MTDTQPAATNTNDTEHLSVSKKLSWSIGAAADNTLANAHNYLAFPIYVAALGVDPKWLSWAVGVPRLVDAISDPVMGYLSDNTQTRFGRRRPYILVGAILAAILFAVMWMPSRAWSTESMAIYLLVVSILYYLAYTVFSVPFNALGLELTPNYHERTRVMSYRTFVMSASGFALGGMWWLSIQVGDRMGGDDADGVRIVSSVIAVFVAICGCIPAFACRERFAVQSRERIGFLAAMQYTITNKPFLRLCAIVFLVLAGLFLVNPFVTFINISYVFQGSKEGASAYGFWGNIVFQGMGLILVPVIAWLGTHLGKKKTLALGLCMVVVAVLSSWFLFTPKFPYIQLILNAMLAPGLSCVWVLSASMIADVCDVDELKTGLRREGMFGAMFGWFCKAGVATTMVLSGYMLDWAGYDSTTTIQTAQTITTLRLLYMIVPAVAFTIAAILAITYPIDEKRAMEVRAELDARKALEKQTAQNPGPMESI